MKKAIRQTGLWALLILLASSCAASKPLVSYPGDLSAAQGWEIQSSQEGKIVYIPFEGYYKSKGGWIQSPKITLDKKQGQHSFYRLRFQSKSPEQCYWWVDLFDKDGNALPDINSAVYPSKDFVPNEVIFYAAENVASVQVAFLSKKGVQIRDIELARIDDLAAAAWCDRLAAQLPKIDFTAPADSFDKLPKTREALKNGTPWRVVMLGDSIVNDTYNSGFQSLVKRDFPKSNLEFIPSFRGSTGCWYYKDPAQFKRYVADKKPNLVMIGGISNGNSRRVPREKYGDPATSMISVINQCKELGVEVLVMSPPPSYEFRTSPNQKTWSESWTEPEQLVPAYQCEHHRKAVAETDVAYWDLTTGPCNLIAASGKPLDWFKRDGAHNNDRGKQVIGRHLAAYFRTCASYRSDCERRHAPPIIDGTHGYLPENYIEPKEPDVRSTASPAGKEEKRALEFAHFFGSSIFRHRIQN